MEKIKRILTTGILATGIVSQGIQARSLEVADPQTKTEQRKLSEDEGKLIDYKTHCLIFETMLREAIERHQGTGAYDPNPPDEKKMIPEIEKYLEQLRKYSAPENKNVRESLKVEARKLLKIISDKLAELKKLINQPKK